MQKALKVMITESDNEAIDDIQKAFDTYLPCCVLEITNYGRQCVNAVQDDGCPDVIILGLDLADISGFDVIEEVRKCSEVPVIAVSYIKDAPVVAQSLNMGADGYVFKPIRQREFIARTKAILRRREIETG